MLHTQVCRALVPALALAGAAFLIGPMLVASPPVVGGSLGLGQRDFRIFNNFTDSEANDNTVPDPSFPGYLGAEMAIWKAAVEWGSQLHGDGEGDPHQPGDLGSGGANFDFSFQGNALGVGNVNANVHSQIDSCGGGTVLFVEGPISDGWRVRYCGDWVWSDGPGIEPLPPGSFDLQAAATFAHGLSLGLSGNSDPDSSMHPSFGSLGFERRSIEPDDAIALQSIYGVKDPTKPRITGLVLAGSALTITGEGFSATDNQVWFTQRGAGGTGAPVKLLGVTATGGGTSISVSVPASAGPGDVLVKRSGPGNAALSNAWPIDPDRLGSGYCAAVPNSTGEVGQILVRGSADVLDDDLTLSAIDLPTQANLGYFIMGTGMNTFTPPGSAGPICITPGLRRLLPPVSNTSQGPGAFTREVGTSGPQTSLITSGSTWNFQAWHRDQVAGTSNLTNAVSVTFL